MKAPVPPPERQTPYPFPPAAAAKGEPGPRKSDEGDFKPKYVALPQQYERGHGRRNLISGVVLFCAAAVLFAWAVYLAGSAALLTLGACLATTMLLSVMARSRLFRQRNAAFVAWGAVCLLAVGLTIAREGWLAATNPRTPSAVAATPAPISAAMAKTGSEAPTPAGPPLLRDAFPGSLAAPDAGPAVRIMRDTTVTVAGKQYLAKAGDFYPLLDVGIGEVHFRAGENEVSVPFEAGEVAGDKDPAAEPAEARPSAAKGQAVRRPRSDQEPAEEQVGGFTPRATSITVDQAQREAIRRYPDLGVTGSMANRAFVSAVKEQRFSDPSFFQDPRWPVTIAELLAEKEGWKRADVDAQPAAASSRRPSVSDEAPLEEAIASPSASPGTSGSRRLR